MSARGPPKHSVSGGFAPYPPTRTGAPPQTPDIGTSSHAHHSTPFQPLCRCLTTSRNLAQALSFWSFFHFSHLNCFSVPQIFHQHDALASTHTALQVDDLLRDALPSRTLVCLNNSGVVWAWMSWAITALAKPYCMSIICTLASVL